MISKNLINYKVWIPPVAAFFLGITGVSGQDSKLKKKRYTQRKRD